MGLEMVDFDDGGGVRGDGPGWPSISLCPSLAVNFPPQGMPNLDEQGEKPRVDGSPTGGISFKNPSFFLTREQLIATGRKDLADCLAFPIPSDPLEIPVILHDPSQDPLPFLRSRLPRWTRWISSTEMGGFLFRWRGGNRVAGRVMIPALAGRLRSPGPPPTPPSSAMPSSPSPLPCGDASGEAAAAFEETRTYPGAGTEGEGDVPGVVAGWSFVARVGSRRRMRSATASLLLVFHQIWPRWLADLESSPLLAVAAVVGDSAALSSLVPPLVSGFLAFSLAQFLTLFTTWQWSSSYCGGTGNIGVA